MRKPLKAKCFAIFTIAFVFMFLQLFLEPKVFSTLFEAELKVEAEPKSKTTTKHKSTAKISKKYILFWTTRYNSPDWGFGRKNIPVDNCVFTNKRNLLDSLDKYDALMFHVSDKSWRENPKVRSSNQSYIMVTAE